MVIQFIENYAKLIVDFPNEVDVSLNSINDTFSELIIKVNTNDVGKLIGKNGNMINALKTMVNACKAKDGVSYRIQVIAH